MNNREVWQIHLDRVVVDGPVGCSPQLLAAAVTHHITRLLTVDPTRGGSPTAAPDPATARAGSAPATTAAATAAATSAAVLAAVERRGVPTAPPTGR